MANPELTMDDEIAVSIRLIQRQRSRKRLAVLGALIAAFLTLMAAVILGYSDTPRGNLPVPTGAGSP